MKGLDYTHLCFEFLPMEQVKIQEVDAEEGEDEDRSAMGGPVDFGGVFKAHIWQPAAALASPRSWIPSLSRFHFGQAPPVINQPCVIAHTLVAPVRVWPTFGICGGEISILLGSRRMKLGLG